MPATSTPRPPASWSTGQRPHRSGSTLKRRCRRLDQRRQPDAEGIAEPQQGADARVGGALLDVDHHPAAHPGDFRQPVQRPRRAGRSCFTRAPIAVARLAVPGSIQGSIMH